MSTSQQAAVANPQSNVPAEGAGEQETAPSKTKRLEKELKIQKEEKENYKKRLQILQKELSDLKKEISKSKPAGVGDAKGGGNSVSQLKEDNNNLRAALTKAAELLKDKTSLCLNQEHQILALTNQVASLKEVVAITKDLLNIRNMEVQHLQSDVDSMEGKINAERQRHNTMISKMSDVSKLNVDLKKEYENQLQLFHDLKEKYEEKVHLLEEDNKKLEAKATQSKDTLKAQESSHPQKNNSLVSDTSIDEFVDAHEEVINN